MDKPPLSTDQIRQLLPHRSPMLLIDRVLEISGWEVVAEKLVSANEPFLVGHFPDRPIMPGVLLIEVVAQAAGIAVFYNQPENQGRGVALLSVQQARFRRPVVPGDTLLVRVHRSRQHGSVFCFEGEVSVEGQKVAEVELTAALVDWERKA